MRKIYLLGSFVAGFSVMTVELLASRIVAPIIGSSVFTWTSVIGTTLLGLSIGSYLGGKMADNVKKINLLPFSFLLSGLLVYIIPFLLKGVHFIGNLTDSMLLINLFVSIYLFLLPALVMGTIQPIILKKYAENIDKIGQEYGLLSSLWSIGSILGVFLTGFFFVSTIGSIETIQIISIILFSLSFAFSIKDKVFIKVILLPVLLILTFFWLIDNNNYKKDLVYEKETNYYKIRIADRDLYPYGETRFLFLDIDSHNAIPKKEDIVSYTKIYPIFSEINDDIKDIIVIGAGAYELPRYLESEYKEANISVIEVDPEIEKVGESFFGLNNTKIKTIISDARIFFQKDNSKYDLIFGDAYNSFISVPWYLLTDEFNQEIKEKLTKNGIYAINFIGKVAGNGSEMTKYIYNTFKKTFKNNIVFGFDGNRENIQNIVIVGLNEDLNNQKIIDRIKKNHTSFAKIILEEKEILNDENKILKDNFSPMEEIMKQVTNEYFSKYFDFIQNLKI